MRSLICAFVCCFSLTCFAAADQPASAANADPMYRQLRDGVPNGGSVAVSNFTLKRDAATFKFQQGTFAFVTPVNGRVTTAVFSGDGEFILSAPTASEGRMLSLLTKQSGNEIVETFQSVVLRFTDDTYDEIKKAGTPPSTTVGKVDELLQNFRDYARKTIKYNFDARILQDVLSGDPGGYFVAFINGQKYSSKLLFTIDPHGAEDVQPEEISLRTYEDNKWGIWAAFHYENEYGTELARGTQDNAAFEIGHQNLDTRIEKNGHVHGNALTTIVSDVGALRAVNFDLFPTLRVQSVADADGNPLPFIQEDKDHDANYWVLLPKAVAKGEKFGIRTIYDGKDAVLDEGNGNYYPVAREDWFPNLPFGRYATYDMKFSVPKHIQLIANGNLVSSTTEGDQAVTVWKADVPEATAGFNLGTFKKLEAKVERGGYDIESYANTDPPNQVAQILQSGVSTMGTMDTTLMMKKPLAEAQLAVDVYNYYFGELPYKRISITQQTACTFGQSWPTLVYLPICSYFDTTVRHQLGLDDDRGYWTVVAPHEIAHQWWGHAVGFNSYRDQWLSEGFADFSASLYLQLALRDNKLYHKFWKDEYDLLTEKNQMGFRGIDAGPLTLGYRLSTTKTGGVTRRLIYPKGAFILQMIRMMMWSGRTQDADFIAFMKDFVHTYYNRDASTEDFKDVLEKHMTPAMDLEGNHKMDWFFNEYVYGTALPSYSFDYSFTPGPDGVEFKFKITQSKVDDSFRMVIPIYLELADGRIARLGTLPMVGNKTEEHTVPLKGLTQAPKRAMLNYNWDVLGAF